MSDESGLYDKITMGGETFRRWRSSDTLEVMQDGRWQPIPYVVQRAINAAISAEREECAKIADFYAEKAWAGQDIAADIRARGRKP